MNKIEYSIIKCKLLNDCCYEDLENKIVIDSLIYQDSLDDVINYFLHQTKYGDNDDDINDDEEDKVEEVIEDEDEINDDDEEDEETFLSNLKESLKDNNKIVIQYAIYCNCQTSYIITKTNKNDKNLLDINLDDLFNQEEGDCSRVIKIIL